ncbi:MAG: hypothetical protein ACJ746_05165 [Bryobacteraceae bacterium]
MSAVEGQYAIWTDPETSHVVKYSLPLFHDLDFQVNEGYRRIPHGGVEIGGVLYGRFEPNGVTIEAFRLIECEHASGPSFLLSEKDLARMKESFGETQSDSELKGLERVGWFISHTRSAPEMTPRENEIFDGYFPGPGRVTLLVKPERFQPTRFVFSVRKPDGQTPERDARNAVILPLPGRAASAVPVQSIPAPDRKEILRRQSALEPQISAEVSKNSAGSVASSPTVPTSDAGQAVNGASESVPTVDDIRRRRSEQLRTSITEQEWRTKPAAKSKARTSSKSASISLALVLVFASLLGCAAGYWAYLQLPPPNIVLRVEKLPTAVLVRWPAEQTRGSNLAAIRVDDGQPMPLTEDQKTSGQIQIHPTSNNVKIELISHHALRDSRGIIRYLQQAALPPAAAPATGQTQNSSAVPATPPEEER